MPWSHVRILLYQNWSIPLWHEISCENPSAFEYSYNLTLFYISPDQNVRKIVFFMEFLVTTSTLRPLTGATWSDARTQLREEISPYFIRSQDAETNFTRDLVKNQLTGQVFSAWLGLYRKVMDRWHSISRPVFRKKSGVPNNHKFNDENCLHMYTLGSLRNNTQTAVTNMTKQHLNENVGTEKLFLY